MEIFSDAKRVSRFQGICACLKTSIFHPKRRLSGRCGADSASISMHSLLTWPVDIHDAVPSHAQSQSRDSRRRASVVRTGLRLLISEFQRHNEKNTKVNNAIIEDVG